MAIGTENPTATLVDENVTNPEKTLDFTTTPELSSEPNTVDSGLDSKPNIEAPVTDVEKKMRRAERFGVQVHFSEEEKRNSRAERFGTSSTVNKSETSTNNSEEIKRKARAERFGLPVPIVASEEEAKKNARLTRFAPYAKPDPEEDDKKKARALRFSTAKAV